MSRLVPTAFAAFFGLVAAAGATPGGAESLLPEDTVFYIGVEDFEASRAALKGKAFDKIMAEGEVKDFLEKPMAIAHAAFGKLKEMGAQSEAMKGLNLDPEKILNGPFGSMFFAFTHLSVSPENNFRPDFGLTFGLEAKPGAVDILQTCYGLIGGLAKEKGVEPEFSTIEVEGRSFQRCKIEEMSLCFAKIDGTSVFSLSETTMRGMLQRAAGSAQGLAKSPDFQRCVENIGHKGADSPVIYVHVGRMMKLFHGLMETGQAVAKDEEKSIISIIDRAMELSGVGDVGPAYTTSFWDGPVAVSRSYGELNAHNARGLIAAVRSGVGSLDRNRLKLVPKDASSFSMGSFDLAPIYDWLVATLKDVAPEIHDQAMAMLNATVGQIAGTDEQGNPVLDLRRDLLGALGGEYFSMSTPGAPTMFGPGTDSVGWMNCRNPQGLQKSLEVLASIPGQMWGFPISFAEDVQDGVSMRVLDTTQLGPMAMMMGGMKPTYAIHDGRCYFGSSPQALKKLLGFLKAPPAENITAKQDFARHVGAIPADAELTSLSYSDTASNFESAYQGIVGAMPFLMMQMPVPQEELPVDLSLLPTAESISQHLFGTVNFSYRAGNAEIMEVRGPFGAEAGLGVAAAAMAIGGGVAFMNMSKLGEAPMIEMGDQHHEAGSDPRQKARDDLNDLSAAITVYTVENGEPPLNLHALVQSTDAYPEGILSGKLPTDPWGNSYQYLKRDSGYQLWSFGPNGTNDSGKGDDLVVSR